MSPVHAALLARAARARPAAGGSRQGQGACTDVPGGADLLEALRVQLLAHRADARLVRLPRPRRALWQRAGPPLGRPHRHAGSASREWSQRTAFRAQPHARLCQPRTACPTRAGRHVPPCEPLQAPHAGGPWASCGHAGRQGAPAPPAAHGPGAPAAQRPPGASRACWPRAAGTARRPPPTTCPPAASLSAAAASCSQAGPGASQPVPPAVREQARSRQQPVVRCLSDVRLCVRASTVQLRLPVSRALRTQAAHLGGSIACSMSAACASAASLAGFALRSRCTGWQVHCGTSGRSAASTRRVAPVCRSPHSDGAVVPHQRRFCSGHGEPGARGRRGRAESRSVRQSLELFLETQAGLAAPKMQPSSASLHRSPWSAQHGFRRSCTCAAAACMSMCSWWCSWLYSATLSSTQLSECLRRRRAVRRHPLGCWTCRSAAACAAMARPRVMRTMAYTGRASADARCTRRCWACRTAHMSGTRPLPWNAWRGGGSLHAAAPQHRRRRARRRAAQALFTGERPAPVAPRPCAAAGPARRARPPAAQASCTARRTWSAWTATPTSRPCASAFRPAGWMACRWARAWPSTAPASRYGCRERGLSTERGRHRARARLTGRGARRSPRRRATWRRLTSSRRRCARPTWAAWSPGRR